MKDETPPPPDVKAIMEKYAHLTKPSGWRPPIKELHEHLPYRVERVQQVNLPVYTDYRNGRTRKLTILRKINGDIEVRTFLFRTEISVFHFDLFLPFFGLGFATGS
jgi:hypothetical protein